MPESKHHSSHGHKHGHRHGHGKRDEERASETIWEWFWSCCNCHKQGGMSTNIVVACPDCAHYRCKHCPMEAVGTINGRVTWGSSMTSSTNPTTAPRSFSRNPSLTSRGEQLRAPADLPNSFASLSLASTTEPSPTTCSDHSSSISSQYPVSTTDSVRTSISSQYPTSVTDIATNRSIPSQYPASITGNATNFDKQITEAPFPDPRSTFELSRDVEISSSTSIKTDNAINYDSDYKVSNLSDSDGEGAEVDPVVHLLDCHLVSVLDGGHDLAAYLIPKIHDRMKQEENLVSLCDLGLDSDNSLNLDDIEHTVSKGKQQASGSSAPTTSRGKLPLGRSSQRHGRGSGESQGKDESGDRKRRKRDTDANSGGAPEGNAGHGSNDPNRRGKKGKGPQRNPDRNPDDPGEDPGDEPASAGSVDVPNFACHFYKLDPVKYGIWTDIKYENCPGSRIKELRHIRYHLEKAHKLPLAPPQCLRCLCSFQDDIELKEHCSAPEGCKPAKGPPIPKDGIDERQWVRIELLFHKKGKKDVDDVARWYEIWRILFPGVQEPSTTRTERPGYMARSNCNLDQLMSEFERRVEDDIQRGILQRDKQVLRYFHHFRQVLDESSAACSSLQLKNIGAAKKEQLGSPETSQTDSWDGNYRSSIDSEDYSLRNTCAMESNLPGNEIFRQEVLPTNFWESSALPFFSLTTSTMGSSDSKQQDDNSSSLERLSMHHQETERNFNTISQSSQLRQCRPGPFEFEAGNVLDFMVSVPPDGDKDAIRTCEPTYGIFDSEYEMSDDILADLLQSENRKPEATKPWKNKHSGNDFLEEL